MLHLFQHCCLCPKLGGALKPVIPSSSRSKGKKKEQYHQSTQENRSLSLSNRDTTEIQSTGDMMDPLSPSHHQEVAYSSALPHIGSIEQLEKRGSSTAELQAHATNVLRYQPSCKNFRHEAENVLYETSNQSGSSSWKSQGQQVSNSTASSSGLNESSSAITSINNNLQETSPLNMSCDSSKRVDFDIPSYSIYYPSSESKSTVIKAAAKANSRTKPSRWAHVLCALWIPEARFVPPNFNRIDVSRVPASRKKLVSI